MFPDRVPRWRFVTAWRHAFRIKHCARPAPNCAHQFAMLTCAVPFHVCLATCLLGLGQTHALQLIGPWHLERRSPLKLPNAALTHIAALLAT